MYIHFDSWQEKYKKPFGAIKVDRPVEFMLEAYDVDVTSVELYVYADGKLIPEIVGMENKSSGRYYATYVPRKSGLYFYYFKLVIRQHEHELVRYYCANDGGQGQLIENSEVLENNSYQLTCYDKTVNAPEWYQNGICYQIFPDRFYNGNLDGYIEGKKRDTFIYATIQDDPMYIRNHDGSIARWDFYGGNLKGIIKKIPYLKKLGISIIYLNPIFEAASNHRYDTSDYFKIDPMLGNEKIFKELLTKLHKAGIHLILDGVFSHVGRNSKYFNFNGNYGKHAGAARDKNSEYYPWFSFERYPDKYRCWWGNADLPVVDKNDPQFQQFIYGEKNSVLAKWNQLGVDGWRLDVADELPDPFIAKIRKNLDGYRERLLLGEVWEDASNKVAYSQRRHYVKGDELDGVMNYPLREAILDLLAQKRSAETIAKEMMKLRENYPLDFYLNSLNNIGTHDTKRVLTALGGDVTKVKRAFELLFMFPGVPCIYYGDEVGLPGGTDPDNRRFYPWGREDHGLLEHVRSLTAKRQAEPALIKGELTLLAGEGFFGVGRYQAGRKVVYLLNASEKPNVFYADKLQQFHDEWNLRAMMTKANGKEFGPFESITLTSDNC